MIKVAHIRSTTGFYGAEKVIFNIFNNFDCKDISLSLLTLENYSEASSLLRNKIERGKHPVKCFKITKKLDTKAIKAIKKSLKLDNIQIVHTHDYKSLFYAVMARGHGNYLIFHHMHGHLNNTLAELGYSFIEKLLINKASLVIVVSQALRTYLLESKFVRNVNITYLENGTNVIKDTNKKEYKGSDVLNLSIVARLTPEKNHILALNVAKRLINYNSNFILNIYGDGPLLGFIKDEISNHGLGKVVNLHGFSTDLKKIYDSTDVLLITSLTEGLPMVLLEAMSYGIPVLSTNVGEIERVLNNETCGVIIPFDADGIVSIISELQADKNKLSRLGEKAKLRIEQKYSVNQQVSKICSYYREIVKNG